MEEGSWLFVLFVCFCCYFWVWGVRLFVLVGLGFLGLDFMVDFFAWFFVVVVVVLFWLR